MASVPSGADIQRLKDTVFEQAENNREHVEEEIKALTTQLEEALMAEKNDLVGTLKAQIAELKDALARPVPPGGGGGGGGGVVNDVNIVINVPPPPAPAAPASIPDPPPGPVVAKASRI